MENEQAKSNGFVEKAIVFLVGIVLTGIGTVAGYYCYLIANTTKHMEYQWVWVTLLAALCFFMLRGAWHTVFYRSEASVKKFDIGDVNRGY